MHTDQDYAIHIETIYVTSANTMRASHIPESDFSSESCNGKIQRFHDVQ